MRARQLDLWITAALRSGADILFDMQWARIAQRQAGVITREQARSAGLSDRQVTSLTRSGMWQRTPRQGVFTVAPAPWTPDRPMWMTALATGGVISHLSAAQLWQLELPTEPRSVHVTIPAQARRRPLTGVVMTRADLSTADRGERFGLAVTSRRRTVLDCLATVSLTHARTMADRCLQRRLITTEGIVSHLEQLPNRPGNGQLRRLLAEVDGAAAASERVLHQLLRQAGVTGWQPNLTVDLGTARYEVDVAFPQWKLAVEVDGWAFHSGVDRFRADRRKQNALTLAGWTVVRFTWIDLVERPDYVVAVIERLSDRAAGAFET